MDDQESHGSPGCGPKDSGNNDVEWSWAKCKDNKPLDKEWSRGDDWCWLTPKKDGDHRLNCNGGPPSLDDVTCLLKPGSYVLTGTDGEKQKHGGCGK